MHSWLCVGQRCTSDVPVSHSLRTYDLEGVEQGWRAREPGRLGALPYSTHHTGILERRLAAVFAAGLECRAGMQPSFCW